MEARSSANNPIAVISAAPVLPYAVEEAINRLRINISFLGDDVKTIMIESSNPNEGKSFIAWHLWQQMAKAGERVLLIDADMRNSNILEKYEIKRRDRKKVRGLSNYLSGSAPLSEVLMRTKNENADLIVNAENVVNPSLLLETRKFKELIEDLSKEYRYVFVDAPPLSIVSDGERIGSYCDGAILSIRSAVTAKKEARESMNQLGRAGCPVLGTVLNRVPSFKSGYYSKYYGRGSRAYYGEYYGGTRKEVKGIKKLFKRRLKED